MQIRPQHTMNAASAFPELEMFPLGAVRRRDERIGLADAPSDMRLAPRRVARADDWRPDRCRRKPSRFLIGKVSDIDQPKGAHAAMMRGADLSVFYSQRRGSDREATGRMPLADDNAARAFGKAMIRDIMRDDASRYAGWTMDVAKGTRPVCSLPFSPERIQPAALG
jgi:hypothetical protein